ncbi:hypothetical protein DYB28_009726 [Aphanomyces astaci]|uniref:PCI domain-containing protein n=1 Tax=Aphanomyces astaci TaxID=112090 RepID=A0A9X8E2T5_APHAT|nr:hypothetical protein DYB28_009726 [Aphanomyces astaci]
MDSTKQSMQLLRIVKELLASCEANAAAVDDDDVATTGLKHDSQLLEVYALQIQLYTVQKDNKKLVELYEKALRVKPGVAHPRIVGVIRECGGKMHMMQGDWEQARNAFFEGFKNFDEAGEARRLQCLKYLVLANMLGESKINVFDSQEAKPYEQAKEIVAMTQLTDAFMNDDIKQFVQGRIDQVNGLLVLRPHKSEEKLVGALNQWTHSLEKLRRQLHDKLLPEAA